MPDDLADFGNEAHVEHAVRFVEDEDLDLGEVHGALPDMVEQAAGRGDEDLDAAPKDLDLRVDARAAIDDRGAERNAAAVGLDGGGDLTRELTGGGQDQDADRMSCRRIPGVGVVAENLQDRQHEGGSLAGAGLGGGENVAAGEDEWDCRALDGRRLRIPLPLYCGEKVGRKAEVVESQTIAPDCVS